MPCWLSTLFLSRQIIIFCVSFIWDIIIQHWLAAQPDWFLEPYILWSKVRTVNFNLLKAPFNLNSESKNALIDVNKQWLQIISSRKMDHIAYLIWEADITIFNYPSIKHLLIKPQLPDIVNWPRVSVSVSVFLFPGPLAGGNNPSRSSSLLWFTLGLNLWFWNITVLGKREGNLRCKAICITQPQIKPHKMKMHNFTLMRMFERDLTIH